MKILYTPWRNAYVTKKPSGDNSCIFCQKLSETDDDHNLVVKRYSSCAVILNAYPYNAGHLLILPLEHKADLAELPEKVRTEIIEATTSCIEAVKTGLKAEGVNFGANLGAAGGGGIPEHLHIHVIPRWKGDTNFLATIGETKTVCTKFEDVLETLRKAMQTTY